MAISEGLDLDERPPPGWKRALEAAAVFSRIHRGFGHLGPRGPEDGAPAMVIPGFIATDRTTMELRRALAEAGWRVHPWGLGLNRGASADILDRIDGQLSKAVPEGPVLMVGWSLGGLFAREYARARPERVRAVVTLGSPFSGDVRANNVWRLYEWVAGHKVDDPPLPRITEKPPVPHLAIWSRRDGIVAPRSARGLPHECDAACEVDCSHMGFGVSRKGVRTVVREIDNFLKK
ncbi:alpha/beta fold hydrolase [Sphingomicrobium lutaoense]|uniref:Pimeloyl-ACP methyl ester carboxylesterase n=1 Tax=Sphingomicrobium lutaoense TaxID=515949 RepID=A0A839Z2V2_9SPHN|nr:alpha/beta hydrolase [Sphingomicrobium lutaoense]MBB3764950.1 pimeloyl-ACP methyl ester carboxylesterase [Sphingomicrobium lutaoense]